ncbi:MAG: hypothetical protein MUF31_15680 [Akkermansiaceae bacterium]|jgi:multidrug transporter EmrE-like cation transporter|nr:hypothetical protein [Akkermansiaceae bacterium]
MSLRAFHIVFVTITTLMCVFLAIWAFAFAGDRTPLVLGLGGFGALGAVVMPVYGVYFYRKARNILL